MKKITVLSALLLAAAMLTSCAAEEDSNVFSPAEGSVQDAVTEAETAPEETAAPKETAAPNSSAETEEAPAEAEPAESSVQQEDAPGTPVMENRTGFPDLQTFSADGLDNTTWTEAEFGKADVTVINLWATFCGPCIAEMPEIAEFQRNLPENVQLVTCCVDIYGTENRMEAEKILSEAGYTGVTLMNATGDLQSLSNQMMYVPTTVFVDSEGHLLGEAIIGAGNVAENYTAHINEALSAMGKDPI